jgi:hypothetical protein
LQADDWVFLRPTQSEFVFLQFGDIAVYDEAQIVDHWPVFSETAVRNPPQTTFSIADRQA